MKIQNILKSSLSIAALSLAALSSTFTACDFLDRQPFDKVDPTVEVTDAVALSMANACYRTLQSSNMYNQRIWTLDIVAGNSNVGAGGGTDGLETVQAANFTTLSDNGMALYMWRSPWVGIGQCNILIQSMESADGLSEAVRNQCLGEALFLRAHYYFILVRLYGAVPTRLTPYEPGTSTAIARDKIETNYENIIADLKRAAELLPMKQEYAAKDLGRATKDACYTELANVYLTLAGHGLSINGMNRQEYYEAVADLCTEVENMGYDLESCKYEDNFDATIHNGAESIFEVQFSGDKEYDFWGNNPQSSWLSTFMGPRNSDFVAGSWGWNQPTEEFVRQYEEGDLRKDITIFYDGCPVWDPDGVNKPYKASYSNTGYNVRKFLVTKAISPDFNTSPANFVVYRFADVLLMKAEALNEVRPAEAYASINRVRRRAGLKDLSGLSQDEMREAIIHERRIELAFEGHRWFDMIRINDGQYAVDFLHSIGKTNATKDRLIFPIPQTERDANPLMGQNPGY
ncbi:MAG: RagB/SusD family nutrient uptake outer membrane protein [Bacteroidales bacterium]|nr:RagB/SusD family nutrient uptake outer membrane protein [Candidatus Colicola faecequi]